MHQHLDLLNGRRLNLHHAHFLIAHYLRVKLPQGRIIQNSLIAELWLLRSYI
jgi:hypothetical protein